MIFSWVMNEFMMTENRESSLWIFDILGNSVLYGIFLLLDVRRPDNDPDLFSSSSKAKDEQGY
jgi:hypothetical protein